MSYKFGQVRRGQISSYSTDLANIKLTIQKEKSPLSQAVVFNEQVINLTGNSILQSTDSTGLKRRYYYIRFKVYKMWDTSQVVTIKLINTLKTSDNVQTLQTVTIPQGYESDYSVFEIVIPPNATYNQVQFMLNRVVEDYSMKNKDGTYGRIMKMEIEKFYEFYNVVDYLNPKIDNKGELKQIGVQGKPGLQMCIDGEGIRIGRSGLYEINNGVLTKFIGFVIEDDKEYFILDYQY